MGLLMRFRKDTQHGLVCGICAGIARGFSLPRKWVRISVLVLLLVMPIATVILYLIAMVLLPPKSRWLD